MTPVLWWLLENALVSAVLAAAVTLLCRPLRRRPAVRHALWVVVLVKMLTPPVVAWPWSVPILRETPDQAGFAGASAGELESVQAGPDSLAPGALDFIPIDSATLAHPLVAEPSWTASVWGSAWVPPALFAVWLAGGAIAGALQLRRIRRHWPLVRRGTAAPESLAAEVRQLGARLGVRPVPALVVRGIASPCVWCLGWLRLLWPERLAGAAHVAAYRGVIAHELAHVKRRDHWVAWLELAAGVVAWWNPVFWYVRRQLREAAEMACDAAALGVLADDARREYAEAFLELSILTEAAAPAPVLGVGAGPRRSFERRFTMMLSDRVSPGMSRRWLVAVGLLAAVALPAWSLGQAPPGGAADRPSRAPRSVAEQVREMEAQRDALQDQVAKLRDRITQLEVQRHEAADRAASAARDRAALADLMSGGVRAVEARLAELKLQEEELTQSFGPNHPQVTSVRKRIETLREYLARDGKADPSLPGPGPLPEEVRAVQAERRALQDQVRKLSDRVRQLETERNAPRPEDIRFRRLIRDGSSNTTEPKADPNQLPGEGSYDPRPQRPSATDPSMGAPTALSPPRRVGVSGGAPADAAPSAVGLGQIDLVSLSTALVEARGALKLAQARVSRLSQSKTAIAQSEAAEAAINLETAENKVNVLTGITRRRLETAEAELAHARRLVESGYAPQGRAAAARGEVELIRSFLGEINKPLTPPARSFEKKPEPAGGRDEKPAALGSTSKAPDKN
jgi:beta-lactamase regulating signal transducer with metallopeptidase domain